MKKLVLVIALLSAFPAFPAAAEPSPSTVEIIVRKRDFLIDICNRYLENPSQWNRIARLNRLPDPNLVTPGQKILIPVDMLKGTPLDGVVTFIKGTVTFRPAKEANPQPLSLNGIVKPGSEIRTGPESCVEVSYEDGTVFLLRENSLLTLQTAKKSVAHYLRRFYLTGGKIVSRIKAATGRASRYEIHTPSAVAEARGTHYRVSVDQRQTTRSEVLKGVVDVSAMEGVVSLKEEEGALVRMNEPPGKPRKLLPPPEPIDLKAVYGEVPFRISLKKTEGAAQQKVVVSRDAEGRDVVTEKTVPATDPVQIDGLEEGSYTLRTFGLDEDGIEGVPSTPVQFRVRLNPLPPMIQSPPNGARLLSTAVEPAWLKVRDAVKYHVQIGKDAQFATVASEAPDLVATRFRAELPPAPYFFRVRSIADDGYTGRWSVVQEFTLVPPPPAPSTVKPEAGENSINLRWTPLGEDISYQVQISRNEAFTSDMVVDEEVDEAAITIPKPEETGEYFVRVRGIDEEERAGDFSEPQSFTIEKRFPYWSLGFLGAIPLILLLAL